jgi:hypothetical protein
MIEKKDGTLYPTQAEIALTVFSELLEHGRPLHVEIIAEILRKRHGMPVSNRRVLCVLRINSPFFFETSDHVFNANTINKAFRVKYG